MKTRIAIAGLVAAVAVSLGNVSAQACTSKLPLEKLKMVSESGSIVLAANDADADQYHHYHHYHHYHRHYHRHHHRHHYHHWYGASFSTTSGAELPGPQLALATK